MVASFWAHSIICCLPLISSALPTSESPLQITLSASGSALIDDDGFVILDRLYAHYDDIVERYHSFKEGENSGPTKRGTADVSLHYARFYHGHIQVGMERTPLKVMFDTGATSSWVPSFRCPAHQCPGSPDMKYQETGKPLNKKDEVTYDAGTKVKGSYFEDTVRMGALEFEATLLSVDEKTSGHPPEQWEGIMGLNLGGGTIGKDRSYMDDLYDSGKIDRKVACFSLGRSAAVTVDKLTFGYPDTDRRMEDLKEIPLAGLSSWDFQLEGIKLGSRSTILSDAGESGTRKILPRMAFIDSGSMLTVLEKDIADAIGVSMGGIRYQTQHNGVNFWAILCEQTVTVGFIFASTAFDIDTESLLYGHLSPADAKRSGNAKLKKDASKGKWCVSSIVSYPDSFNAAYTSDMRRLNILGIPFMKGRHTCFDWGKKQGHTDSVPVVRLSEDSLL